jgi:peptide chain release factor 2
MNLGHPLFKRLAADIAYLKQVWASDTLVAQIADLDHRSQSPDFWQDQATAATIMKQKSLLESRLQDITDYEETLELSQLCEPDEIDCLLLPLQTKVERSKLACIFKPEDSLDCFVQVKAGAGGKEARDWAGMIFRMYNRYAERTGYKLQLLEESVDADGMNYGLLKICASSTTAFPYGYLKHESGSHRLVRISPFDSNRNRHTSFVGVDVFPVTDKTIDIQIDERDIERQCCRSSGAGGQHVNTTDSAVRLHHKPTGIVVRCESGRSQHKNLEEAMNILRGKLYQHELQKQQASEQERLAALGSISWGAQIRSYVLHPYQLVLDLRTRYESQNPQNVLDGDLQGFLDSAVTHFSLTDRAS